LRLKYCVALVRLHSDFINGLPVGCNPDVSPPNKAKTPDGGVKH